MRNKIAVFILSVISFAAMLSCDNEDSSVTGYDNSDKEFYSLLLESKDVFKNEIKSILSLKLEMSDDESLQELTPNWNAVIAEESENLYCVKVPLLRDSPVEIRSVIQYLDNNSSSFKVSTNKHVVRSYLVFTKEKEGEQSEWYVENVLEYGKSTLKSVKEKSRLVILSNQYGDWKGASLNGKSLELRSKDDKSLEFVSLVVSTSIGNKSLYFNIKSISKAKTATDEKDPICSKCGFPRSALNIECSSCTGKIEPCSRHGWGFTSPVTGRCSVCYYEQISNCTNCSAKGVICIQGLCLPCIAEEDAEIGGTPPYNHVEYMQQRYIESVCNNLHPYDLSFQIGPECNTFIQCIDGEGHLFTCPEGLVFNYHSQCCDYPLNVDCTDWCDPEGYEPHELDKEGKCKNCDKVFEL